MRQVIQMCVSVVYFQDTLETVHRMMRDAYTLTPAPLNVHANE
jgi:hypothetical protein